MSVSPTPVNASPKQSSNTTSSTVPQSQSPTMPSITSSKLQSSSSSNIANASRSQLATMLTNALHEADSYRQQFEFAQQRASKFERIVNTLGLTSDSNGSLSINGQSTSRNREDDIKSHLLDAENRVERAERAQLDAEARLNAIVSQWTVMEQYLATLEVRFSDARNAFIRLIQSAPQTEPAAISLSLPSIPAPAPALQQSAYLAGVSSAQSSPGFSRRNILQAPPPNSQLGVRSSMSQVTTTPFQALPLPPPPSASIPAPPHVPAKRSHRRSIVEDYDLPQKRSRLRGDERDLSPPPTHQQPSPPYTNHSSQAYSSTSRIPHDSSRNPHGSYSSRHHSLSRDRADLERERHLSKHISNQHLPTQHPYDSAPAYSQHTTRGYPSHTSPVHRAHERGRPLDRGYHRHSGSRSMSADSSQSIDEMLIEATTDQKDSYTVRGRPSSAQIHGGHNVGGPGHVHSNSTGQVNGNGSGHPNDVEVGPLRDPPSVQQYQTHIFAPPVTGAPTKKNKTVPANQLVTLGPGGVIVSGGGAAVAPHVSSLPGGGYPAVNQQGQRICRQCGMPGRYKEGKCVEKWGPGPEGPGTVCDRCRKKMKRVERRGTMDNLANRPSFHHNPSTSTASAGPTQPVLPASRGVMTVTSGSGMGSQLARASPPHRQDTIIVNESQSQRGNASSSGSTGPQPLSPRGGSSYGQFGRGPHSPAPLVDRTYGERAATGQTPATRTTSHRRGPTPPLIESIPTRAQNRSGSRSSGHEDEDEPEPEADNDDVDAELARTLPGGGGSRSGSGTASVGSASPKDRSNGSSRLRQTHPHMHSNGTGHLSQLANTAVNGQDRVKVPRARPMEADADVDADDGDGDGDGDAEAELMDAVLAADTGRMKQEDI